MIDKATLDDLWAEADDYIPQSIEDVTKELKAKFKKNKNSLYFEKKDLDSLLGIKKQTFGEYIKGFGNSLDRYFTKTVAGDFLIFNRFKEYRGVKVYELNDDDDFYIIENKGGVKYIFNVYLCNSIKGVGNTLIFVDYDGDLIIYDIEKDEFSEGE